MAALLILAIALAIAVARALPWGQIPHFLCAAIYEAED